MTQTRMTFGSEAFKNAAESLSGRASNTNTVTQRMGLGDTSNTPGRNDFSASQAQSTNANNNAISTSPYFQRSVYEDNRNFAEDNRRFDTTTSAKSSALANEQSTLRYQSDNTLAGNKYGADAGVKSTQINADANRYGADQNLAGTRYVSDTNLAGTRLQTDASRYGADKGYQASIYGADANLAGNKYAADSNVKAASIGADASRFNALLSTGVGFFNSSQYKPTFNR